MQALTKRFNDENRDAILAYLEAGGEGNEEGIALTDKQLALYNRWELAAEKIREKKYKREQIAKFICAAFKVSRDTAYRDIVNAEHVFAASCPLNKNFLIQQRIELLETKIHECYVNNDYLNAGLLERTLQKYIDSYPENVDLRPPAPVHYHFTQNVFNNVNMTAEEAMQESSTIIKQIEERDDY